MTAKILNFAAPSVPLKERLAVRRAYRKRCRQIAAESIAAAFRESGKGTSIGIDDAVPIFVAAMRRELKRSGMF